MPTRRSLIQSLTILTTVAGGLPVRQGLADIAAAELGDDGLHKQPWFTDSFLELGDA